MNQITLCSVAELLDGRSFFIPAYQRGYRWGATNMRELLRDLFEFALKDKSEGEFYCLQPIIVKKIADKQRLDNIKATTEWSDMAQDNTWEVVDGQQRLTSIYIIYRYLIAQEIVSEKKMAKAGKSLYSICYETHTGTRRYLETLSDDGAAQWDDIDEKHIADAYREVEAWFEDEAPTIARRMGYSDDLEEMQTTMRKLLNCGRDATKEKTGSAQFIWYELQADSGKNPIDEFLNINNGKIRLTDAELTKALFLQERNFAGSELQKHKQAELALAWENMENALHRDDFWQFLCAHEQEGDNRMELLLRLRYQQDHDGADAKEGYIFRYYYDDIWKGQAGDDLRATVLREWQKISDLFHVLESWYEDPVAYNYVGFLIHAGRRLHDIVKAHYNIDKNAESRLFLQALRKMIEEHLPKRADVESGEIKWSYKGERNKIKTLLLFLNIHQLNRQISAVRQAAGRHRGRVMAPVYKFPFDLYVAQHWDVEHIDSATTNDLSKAEDQEAWLRLSADALGMSHDDSTKRLLDEKKYGELWAAMLQRSGSEEGDSDMKDTIGNLTLLDSATNRSYGNHIFAVKRAEILKAINGGTFVPLCTQLVFNKSFDGRNTDLRKWSDDDKQSYSDFICKQLKDFYGDK